MCPAAGAKFRGWSRRAALLSLLAAAACASSASIASPARAADPEAREVATRAFEEGERAFEAGDFVRAGDAFEAAHRAVPHSAPLWNAARSWQKAGEIARAATLYARYLREAPPDAPDRDAASVALAELAPRLGRIEVYAPDVEEIRIDDRPLEGPVVYVNPGTHVLEGRSRGRLLRRTEVLEAGATRSAALVEEPGPALGAPITAPLPRPRPAEKPTAPRPSPPGILLPALTMGAGSATLVMTGATVWSGIDTLAARREFDANPTQDRLDSGRKRQIRTNTLLGTSLGLGALTAAAASAWILGLPSSVRTQVAITLPVQGGVGGVTVGGSF
ncbi:hypothetical protein [Polyangium aurulentum]|uniref:hypothetical protein n=1 Tax=Polyangium aurulentum TaxID=2567896 RepID=UPI0010AE2C64|nr:hypothetical protein [Polyangium aurulentum]UQA63003.1 hypothetical protein E8A73_022110 [Polyangium aurulentum]